jgi:zona occludens toxin (predicted ATPase)
MKSYHPDEIRLANEIAETLQDREALPLYLRYCTTYTEAFLRKMLARVMSIEESKIRKTRGALFTFLVSQHGKTNYSRD